MPAPRVSENHHVIYCTSHQSRPALSSHPSLYPTSTHLIFLGFQIWKMFHPLIFCFITVQDRIAFDWQRWPPSPPAFVCFCPPFHDSLLGQMKWTSPDPALFNACKLDFMLPDISSQANCHPVFRASHGEKFDKRRLTSLSFSHPSPLFFPYIHTLSSFYQWYFLLCYLSNFYLPALPHSLLLFGNFFWPVSTDIGAPSTLKFPY